MHPVLFRIGPLALRSYGLLLALSFFLGILWASRRLKEMGGQPGRMMDLSVVVIIAAIVGSRLFYVLFHWPEFAGHLLDIVNPFSNPEGIGIAGLSMDGGVFLAIVGGLLYLRRTRQPILLTLDAMAPSFALGIFLTRIGCFLNGCCFGKPTSGWPGVIFPLDSLAGWTFPNVPLHPAQLYNALGGLVMLGLILWLERYRCFAGFSFLLTLIFYGLLRLGVDFFRHFEANAILIRPGGVPLTVNQLLSGGAMLVAIALFVWYSRRRPDHRATAKSAPVN